MSAYFGTTRLPQRAALALLFLICEPLGERAFADDVPVADATGTHSASIIPRIPSVRSTDAIGHRSDNPEGIARERYLQRADSTGSIPQDALVDAKRHLDAMRIARKGFAVQDAGLWTWEWLGPGNIGGRIRSILIDPSNPKMFVGSVSGGIWRTSDAGGTWAPVDDFMANLAVTSMVMDPTNTNIMYAATGVGFGNFCGGLDRYPVTVHAGS